MATKKGPKVIKKPQKKSVRKRKDDFIPETPWESEEEETEEVSQFSWNDEDEEEKYRRGLEEIADEFKEFLAYRNDYMLLQYKNDWAIVARVTNLKVNRSYNEDSGFMPLSTTKDERKCLLAVVEFGDEEAERGSYAHFLKRKGCPVVRLKSAYDVSRRMQEI